MIIQSELNANFTYYIDKVLSDNLLILAIPVFMLLIFLEFFHGRRKQLETYHLKDTLICMGLGIAALVVEFIPKVLAFMAFDFLHDTSPLKDIVRRQWWAWALLIFADDFCYYWFHRLNHEVRLFWAGHVNHHSSVYYNYAVAQRQGVGERLHKYLFWLLLPLLGFDPLMIFTAMSINLIFQYWVHTEFIGKLPQWFEFIFNTPSHHRVHHASNARYLDRNHTGIFILWDRLFGSFAEEKEHEKPVYGLTKNLTSDNFWHVTFHEYIAIWKDVQRANKWSDKLKYIFYAPGWSHDGPDLRAKTLRKQVNDN